MQTLLDLCSKAVEIQGTLRKDRDVTPFVYADVFYTGGKSVLQMVDKATNFQAAKWIKDMQAETLWRALRMCRIDVHLGVPDLIVNDAGKYFMTSSFQTSTDM